MIFKTIYYTFFLTIFFYFLFPYFIKILINFYKRLVVTKRSNTICLTFDDGPDNRSTPKIIEILKKYNIKATFFLLGTAIERYPEIVSQIMSYGHEIGEHGYAHIHPWLSNPVAYIKDLNRSNRIIRNIFKRGRILFRPPYGKLNIITIFYILISKKKLVFWDFDPKDYKVETSFDIVELLERNVPLKKIVLLHDGRISGNLNNPVVSVIALDKFLKTNKSKLNFVLVNELI